MPTNNNVDTPFNPQFSTPQNDYMGYSKGADAPRATPGRPVKEADNSLSGAINLFNVAVDAKDTIYKARIQEETTADVDAVRDAWNGTAAPGGIDEVNASRVPADLRIQGKRMDDITNAYRSGAISDRHYWAQMENIARATRARYPGYREFIDKQVSSLTGGTPANELQRSIAEEASKTDKSGQETASMWDWYTKNPSFDPSTGAYLTPPANYTEFSRDQTRAWVSNAVALGAKNANQLQMIQVKKAQGEDVQRQSAVAFSNTVDQEIGQTLQPAIDAYNKKRQEFYATGAKPSPDEVSELTKNAAAISASANAIADKYALNRDLFPDLSPDDVSKKKAATETMIKGLFEGVAGSNWNLADNYKDMYEMQLNAGMSDLMNNSEEARRAAILRNIGGDVVANNYLSLADEKGDGSNLSAITRSMSRSYKTKLAQPGNTTTVMQVIDEIQHNTNMTQKEKNDTLQQVISGITKTVPDTKMPISIRAENAKALFSPDNISLLNSTAISERDNKDDSKNTNSGRLNLFRQLNSPQMAKGMVELRDAGYTDVYNQFVNWREGTYTALVKPELDKMQYIPSYDQTMNIQVGTDGKIITQNMPGTAMDSTLSRLNDSQGAVSRYNNLIESMTPAWKLEGKDPLEESKNLLASGGVDPAALKQPSFYTRLFDSLGLNGADAVRARREPLLGTGSDPLDKGNDPFKGQMNLGVPAGPSDQPMQNPSKAVMEMFDVLTGIPSIAQAYNSGDRWSLAQELGMAGLTVIPGGKIAGTLVKGAEKTLGPILKVIEGGLGDAERTAKEAKSVLNDWTAEANKAAQADNQMFAKIKAKYGENVSNQISMNVLNNLPKPHSSPLDWTKEQSLAVANVLGRESYLRSRPGLLDEAVLKDLSKLAQQYRMTVAK